MDRFCWLFLGLAIGATGLLFDQPVCAAEREGEVFGKVLIDGMPLSAGLMTIYLGDGKFRVATIRKGKFAILQGPVGTWKISIRGAGVPERYGSAATTSLVITINEGQQQLSLELLSK